MAESMETSAVVVCVTAQLECERLIMAGRRMADDLGGPVQVLSVQPVSQEDDARAQSLGSLYEIAKKSQASISVYYNDDPAIVAAAHVKRCGADTIVTGFPENGSTNHFIDLFRTLVPEIRIVMVSRQGVTHTIEPSVCEVRRPL